ncbi:MAG: amidohydrolase family protein [Acidobacteriota bacterium]
MNTKIARIIFTLLLLFIMSTAGFAGDLVIQGGTVLTVTNGIIENGSILIRDGKIAAIGESVTIPPGADVINAEGKYIMPGIIDSHSHLALNGDINESTDPVTSQVDMADAIDAHDYQIYQSLAGGVTAAKLMHGSANVIGGLNTTVKLKYRTSMEEMRIPGVRQQLKMALGENPKRVYGSKGQQPSTRPGIFATLRQTFMDAQSYQKKWEDYEKKKAEGEEAALPRRDLKLETIAKALSGEYGIDCHNYVHNEIVVFLDIIKEFNVPYVVLSHSFGAYKVRDRIAEAGVGIQTHTDWWGYKAEAYDAIPYAIKMMMNDGIVVNICSDSEDVIRRLNREAAKMIKYSDMSEEDALRLITINPAKILEIENRTGSLETGKDADIAIFDRHPLDSFSKCVMTLIEGEIYFDINSADKTALK